jgi:SAM-dependent methyltransferase
MNSESDPQWVTLHRAIWARKPALRWYYEHEQFRRIDAQVKHEPVLEVGAGPAFLSKSLSRRVLASDVYPHLGIDVCADVHYLPFRSDSVGSVVAVDVLHHLARPSLALAEIARVLQPGGRFVLVEPWAGTISGFILKWFHHEDHASVEDPWNAAMRSNKDPMEGNTWISKALLVDRARQLPIQVPGLTVRLVEPFGAISYLASGGFQRWSMPRWFCQFCARLESLLPSVLLNALSFRVLVVVEKSAST